MRLGLGWRLEKEEEGNERRKEGQKEEERWETLNDGANGSSASLSSGGAVSPSAPRTLRPAPGCSKICLKIHFEIILWHFVY